MSTVNNIMRSRENKGEVTIEVNGDKIGDLINGLVEYLKKKQLGFFVAEEVLAQMCEVKSYNIGIRAGDSIKYTSVSYTEGYKKHQAEWDKIIADELMNGAE